MPISRGETKVLRERKGALCSGESGLLLHCTKVSLAAANGVVECLAEPLLRRCAPEVGSSTAFFFSPLASRFPWLVDLSRMRLTIACI